MKIRLKGRIGAPRGKRSGDVVDYPDDQAKRMIDRGYAEPVIDEKPVRHVQVETTRVVSMAEKAVKRKK